MVVVTLILLLSLSVVLNVAMAIPFVIWFRALMRVGRSERYTREAFEHLFGHLQALRGWAVVFHRDGGVSLRSAGHFALPRQREPDDAAEPPVSRRGLMAARALGWIVEGA